MKAIRLASALAAFTSIVAITLAQTDAPNVKVNRTVPNVKPPKTTLEFSANPTTQEISRARVFGERLVPIGGEPSTEENAALAAALLGYVKRSGPDDFSSLTGFLEKHPKSPWRAVLLTDLGLEYYNTAHYSLALKAWEEARSLGQKARDTAGKFLADRAVCELAGLYSRLGRMTELAALLKSVENRTFIGGATERINMAHEALSLMQYQPEISFRCGPLALQRILVSDQRLSRSAGLSPTNAMAEIFNSASTQKGFSLPQVAELSKKVGLNYQMAFRSASPLSPSDGERGAFIVPSVVHWKVGHYAAMVRKEGDRYLIEDPTFGNSVWATKQALEAETSGYFLIPPGDLPRGWRTVDAKEGSSVWGKGVTSGNDPDQYTCRNEQTASCSGAGCSGMAVSSVHLMLANLQIRDTPVGYTPPVGPPVQFTVRYNHRDYLQSSSASAPLFGPKWTHDWNESIKDNPNSPLADVKYHVGGGGARTFTGFNPSTQTFAPEQYDQTQLKRIGANIFTCTYELLYPDGSKRIFAQPDGSIGSSRKIFLTQVVDPQGNAVTLTYDQDLHLVAITDALGQVTTLSYGVPATDFGGFTMPADPDKITKVTDPFGRFATFSYGPVTVDWNFVAARVCPTPIIVSTPVRVWWLESITDVLGLASQFHYLDTNRTPVFCVTCPTNDRTRCVSDEYSVDFIDRLSTPYGTTTFFAAQGGGPNGTTRSLETFYADGSRDRVEYNQTVSIPNEVPAFVPAGMLVHNEFLGTRNTFYWSRTAYASNHGDYSKAKIFHWLHGGSGSTTAGILESTKEALERRVWYNYPDQGGGEAAGSSSRPTKIGRVLDDGSTQLHIQAYNQFGRLTNSVDPLGRTLSFVYATNGIDLLEVRQTRAGNNELLFRAAYNTQHQPLTVVDAAGQTNTFTYNARGQPLTATNPKGETSTYTYDADGYLIAVDGPLAGTNDTLRATYDAFGRVRTMTGVSGYTLTFSYDAMDRIGRITHPDSTFEAFGYDRLDLAIFRDRAGRQTSFEYDPVRQMKQRTDPLGRVTRFDWCLCGQIESLTDPMGRTTTWLTDVQGRPTSKQYADGSQITYHYEETTSRLRFVIDEKQQVTQFTWNRDDSLRSIAYANAVVPTPSVSFTYDPDYERVASMTDGAGTTRYSYNPVPGTPAPGAGALASVDGPLPNDTITFSYDELGRPIHRAINGVDSAMTFDAAGRLIGVTNALGAFAYAYDGPSGRLVSKTAPNGQTTERSYGNTLQDLLLQRITHTVDAMPISEFLYGRDATRGRITTWSQQTGTQSPDLFTFGYDSLNQLLSASVTNAGNPVNAFAYTYDLAGNRLTEQVGASNYMATYNGLNEIRTTTAPGALRTNEWDAVNRLVAVNIGNQRTEFTYDGASRMVAIRKLVNGSQVSHRQFVWCSGQICEERDGAGAITKRFFPQGVKLEAGPATGSFFYTRDHLGSIRELIDGSGNLRARYAYDPYGRTKLTGDMETDFGFAGMFWTAEANLALTQFRAYDPELGRWLSRDPLGGAELSQGPNLYAYVANEPVSRIDPEGLCFTSVDCACLQQPAVCVAIATYAVQRVAPYVYRATAAVQRALPFLQRSAQCAEAIAEREPVPRTLVTPRFPNLEQWIEGVGDLKEGIYDLGNRYHYLTRPFTIPGSEGHSFLQQLRMGYLPDEIIYYNNAFWALAEKFAPGSGMTVREMWLYIGSKLPPGADPALWF